MRIFASRRERAAASAIRGMGSRVQGLGLGFMGSGFSCTVVMGGYSRGAGHG